MKKTIIGLLAAVSIIGGLTTVADAKVSIFFGVPYYDYQYGPDYRYYDGRGWYLYQPGYQYYPDYQYQPRYRYRISCNEARRIVRDRGYRNVQRVECQGRTYTFNAMRRGISFRVYVNSRTGAVWRG